MKIEMLQQPNTCGSCTLCCKVLAIRELNKEKDVWCTHASRAKGCDIYGHHPESCQNFFCEWLSGNWHSTFRPDKVHGVSTATTDGTGWLIHEDPGYPGVASALMRDYINDYIADGRKFVIVLCGQSRRLIARPDLAQRMLVRDTDEAHKFKVVTLPDCVRDDIDSSVDA